MSEPEIVYDGRVSARCAQSCVAGGGCSYHPGGLYTDACGGCCNCRGGCELGYYEQLAELRGTTP
jgi:hypothetical protein